MKKKRVGLFIAIIIAYVFIMGLSISLGAADISIKDAFYTLFKSIPFLGSFLHGKVTYTMSVIIFKVRMPRIIMASIVGMGLAVVGTSFQAVFKNPMADPYILGISSGAALGAAIGIVLHIGGESFQVSTITAFAFVGAILTTFIVYNIARVGNTLPVTKLLLSGIAINFMISSIISIIMVFSHEELQQIVFWSMGSFNAVGWKEVAMASPFVIIGTIITMIFSRDLDIMLTGEDTAKTLGIEIEKVKKTIIIVSSVMVAAAVAFCGIIGFVGLIIPHILRLILGPNNRTLILFSAVGGAIFLLFADTLARTVAAPAELPVGAITALLGSPYFLYLLTKNRKG